MASFRFKRLENGEHVVIDSDGEPLLDKLIWQRMTEHNENRAAAELSVVRTPEGLRLWELERSMRLSSVSKGHFE